MAEPVEEWTKWRRAQERHALQSSIVGTQPPGGYMDWHNWAEAQHKAGLRQKRCRTCGLYMFPQEKCACRFRVISGDEKHG